MCPQVGRVDFKVRVIVVNGRCIVLDPPPDDFHRLIQRHSGIFKSKRDTTRVIIILELVELKRILLSL